MSARIHKALAPLLALAAACALNALANAEAPDEDPVPPETNLELYNLTVECMFYSDRMVEALRASGAPQTEISRYGEMSTTLPWLVAAVAERLSQEDRKKVVTEPEVAQRLDRFTDPGTLTRHYDRRCLAAYENFDRYAEAIERRLVRLSGEPFPELIERCVTLSTGLLTVKGHYLGMTGPSVKPVPKGGLPPINMGDGDRYKIALAHGTVADWDAKELPRPPELHTRLLAMGPDEQAATLAEALARFRRDCRRPFRPFFRGRDHWGRAYWAVSCAKRQAYSVVIDGEGDARFGYDCQRAGDGHVPECYAPCSGMGCFSAKPGVNATIEHVPHMPMISVRKAPPGECGDEISGHVYQNRGDLPDLKPGEAHRIAMSIADKPECTMLRATPQLVLEIHSTAHLDVLKIDLDTLDAPHMRPDTSAGPPCQLVHLDPVESEYADLRCRVIADVDRLLEETSALIVRGRFMNGDPFEGEVEVCR